MHYLIFNKPNSSKCYIHLDFMYLKCICAINKLKTYKIQDIFIIIILHSFTVAIPLGQAAFQVFLASK